jgi:localization factor PodJL
VPADAKQANSWYEEAAKRGNRKAMHNLAIAYANGTGQEKNFTEAARWFRAAAEQGLADSQFNLAVVYERGLGVRASLADAYKWYAIAAAEGDAESKSRVAALATQIPPAEREAADRAAGEFKLTPMNREANEAPDLAQIAP